MKTIEEIYEEMLSVFREETGAEASAVSDLSVRLYAVAAQVYGLYAQAEWLSQQCFPQTAQGEWLDRHATLRGLERRGAVPAEGSIRFSVTTPTVTDLTIPKGTVCATAGSTRFETTQAATLTAGETSVLVPARAVEPGEAGNVPAGSILAMAVPPVGVGACVNPEAFTGGAEAEDDEALRARVLATYRRMPNGANAAYYEQEALSFEGVADCVVIPRSRGQGTVDVVIAAPGGGPSEELVEKLQQHFDERREIAVDVQVKAPNLRPVDVTVYIALADGADRNATVARVKQAVENAFTGARLGKDLTTAEISHLTFTQEGVKNCRVFNPYRDLEAQTGDLFTLKSVEVEVRG